MQQMHKKKGRREDEDRYSNRSGSTDEPIKEVAETIGIQEDDLELMESTKQNFLMNLGSDQRQTRWKTCPCDSY